MSKAFVNCPKCDMPLHDNFCMHCGYMTNGVYIGEKEVESISDVEMYLGERYDKINRNQNSFLAFVLGPFYFAFNKFPFFGSLCLMFDIAICSLALFLFDRRPIMALFFSFLTLRILYAAMANTIYLWLLKFRVSFIKKVYKDKYIDELRKRDKSTTSFLFLFLGIAIAVTILILIWEAITIL